MKSLFNSLDHLEDPIDGDRFSRFADWTWNDREKNLEGMLDAPGIVFCKTDYLQDMFEMLKHSSHRYILISHNSDHNIDAVRYSWKPKNVVTWFAQNVIISRHDLIPIPIGLERPGIAGSGNVQDLKDNLHRPTSKDNLLHMGFADATNPTRPGLRQCLKNNPWVTHYPDRIPFRDFLQTLQSHQFVLAPPGNGSDCHRTWETYYANSIPVCQKNPHNEIFSSILPMFLYERPEDINQAALEKKIEEVVDGIAKDRYTMRALRFTFWKEMIEFYAKTGV